MTHQTSSSSIKNNINKIKEAVQIVFKDSEQSIKLQQLCEDTCIDLDNLKSQRGINKKILTFIGHKNAGKSTLCKLLVLDEAAKQRIEAGTGNDNATTKITWIGDQTPSAINLDHEKIIPVNPESLIDLSAPYILADVPGYDDLNEIARLAAKKILGMTHVVIAATSWDQIGDESYLRQLQHTNGARILPVITDSKIKIRPEEHAAKNIEAFTRSIKKWCPDSEILTPVRIPRIDNFGELAAQAQSTLITALTSLLQRQDVNPVPIQHQKYTQLLQSLAVELHPFLSKIRPYYENLNREEKKAAATIAREIIGDDRQLRAYLRIRLLSETVETCSPIYFPFRLFASLWALTIGAWDRLILALFGSLPSLFSVMVQSGKNIKNTFKNNDIARTALRNRCSTIAKNILADPERIFYRSVKENLPESFHPDYSKTNTQPELCGLDELESETSRVLLKGINASPPKKKTINTLGAISTILWITLMAGPAFAIYSAFLKAWSAAFYSGNTGLTETWQNFPAPDFGMMATSLFLIFLPVFILSFIPIVSSVTQKRQKKSAQTVHQKMEGLINELNNNNTLHLHREDEVQNAVKLLLNQFSKTKEDQ